jgi:hypothetical protein
MGAEVGLNAEDLEGCYDLSNPITVIRHGVDGGSIATADGETELTICAGDGISDAFDVVVTGGEGDNSGWVITDDNLNILALPSSPPFDLEGAGEGTCLVWYLRYNGDLMGAEVGLNAGDLEGCYDLSNPITVVRLSGNDCQVPCAAPTVFDVTILNGNRAFVDWNPVPDAFFYYVRYREIGTNNWRYRFSFNSQRVLNGIFANRSYEYQIITYCFSDGFSAWSDVQYINAVRRSARSAEPNQKVLEIEASLEPEQKEDELLLYPNPVQDVLNIQHTFNAEEVELKVYSVEGKLIMDEAKKGFDRS